MTKCFKIEFFKYKKSFSGELHRIQDSFSVVVVGFSYEDAFRQLEAYCRAEGYFIECYSYNLVAEIDLYSSEIISRIIKDRGQEYLEDLKKKQAYEQEMFENNGLSKRSIWSGVGL